MRGSVILGALLTIASIVASCGEEESERPTPVDEDPVPDDTVVTQDVPPPPIAGGTMVLGRDGRTVVATDPDRARIWLVDVVERAVVGEIALADADDPGRVIEDGDGRAHAVLRNGGKLVTIDLATRSLVREVAVCAAPRSAAYDASAGVVHVACAGGELVSVDPASGAITGSVMLERDLRDILVHDGQLLVTSFRKAEVLVVEAGEVVRRLTPPSATVVDDSFVPRVAWRLFERADGGVALLHQRAQTTPVTIGPNAYQDGVCSGAVAHGTVTIFDEAALRGEVDPAVPTYVPDAVLPVDAAISPDGKTVAVVSAGNDVIVRMPSALFESNKPCGWAGLELQTREEQVKDVGQPIAVAYDDMGRLLVQSREPAMITVVPRTGTTGVFSIPLSEVSRRDTGHDLFHRAPEGAIIACASCHAEGGDDGHVWDFVPDGIRRTQNVRGGISQRAPFHWAGDLGDFPTLVSDTLVKRMGGAELTSSELEAFAHWLDTIPGIPFAGADAETLARGKAVFDRAACSQCHGGPKLTSTKLNDVGTGGIFKVPTLLNLPFRAPYMHDGCATTLHERFDPACGGDEHGSVADLTPQDIDDLVAFMESPSAVELTE